MCFRKVFSLAFGCDACLCQYANAVPLDRCVLVLYSLPGKKIRRYRARNEVTFVRERYAQSRVYVCCIACNGCTILLVTGRFSRQREE